VLGRAAFEAVTSEQAHPSASLWVIEQLAQLICKMGDVIGPCVQGPPAEKRPSVWSKGEDGFAERHVLENLVHDGLVVHVSSAIGVDAHKGPAQQQLQKNWRDCTRSTSVDMWKPDVRFDSGGADCGLARPPAACVVPLCCSLSFAPH
jgi:hypothetical protein